MSLTSIWVGGRKLSVDIAEELLPYFNGYKVRWTEDKLVAPSPFREDKSPSFFVNLVHIEGKEVAGTWVDSGAYETDYYRSGKLEKLLAYLRNESEEETIQYLCEKYGYHDYDKLKLSVDLKVKSGWKPLVCLSDSFAYEYLQGRGISKEVIKNAGVMDLGDKVAFLWYSSNGVIEAIKYRYKNTKAFYYEKGGKRLNEKLYNLQRVYEKPFHLLWITEGETDALTVETASPVSVGVALGGASFSDKQRDLLVRTGISNVVIATDNDKQGQSVATVILEKLGGYLNLFTVNLDDCKDINEYFNKYHKLPNIQEAPIHKGFKMFPSISSKKLTVRG